MNIPISCTIRQISLVPWCVGIDRFHCTFTVDMEINCTIVRVVTYNSISTDHCITELYVWFAGNTFDSYCELILSSFFLHSNRSCSHVSVVTCTAHVSCTLITRSWTRFNIIRDKKKVQRNFSCKMYKKVQYPVLGE